VTSLMLDFVSMKSNEGSAGFEPGSFGGVGQTRARKSRQVDNQTEWHYHIEPFQHQWPSH